MHIHTYIHTYILCLRLAASSFQHPESAPNTVSLLIGLSARCASAMEEAEDLESEEEEETVEAQIIMMPGPELITKSVFDGTEWGHVDGPSYLLCRGL